MGTRGPVSATLDSPQTFEEIWPEPDHDRPLWAPRKRDWVQRLIRSRVFYAVVVFLVLLASFGRTARTKTKHVTPSLGLSPSVTQSWAQYSPYFPLDTYKLPSGCSITQVNIIQRHGARFPTEGAEIRIMAAVENLKKATAFHDRDFEFLTKYTYDLGQDDLIPFGVQQSYDAGQDTFERYSHLVSRHNVPFVRASSSSRVVASATNWSAGFLHASGGLVHPPAPLILDQDANDTLADHMCDNVGNADAQTTVWQDTFAPAVIARLNKAAPGATLNNVDIPNLISLCAFDSVAKQTNSPWCNIFTQQDFDNFNYYGDLNKYYNTGYGQPLGPVQGVGYVNELIARLTGSPVNDSTQTNSTLDTSPATFPLDRTVYADFSHDNQMIAIYAAMGIIRPNKPLDPKRPDPHRIWRAAHLVPFSGRLVTERLHCGGRGAAVRMLLDDQVVPLEICGAREDGICSLDAFVRSQAYARNNGEGDWEKCFT